MLTFAFMFLTPAECERRPSLTARQNRRESAIDFVPERYDAVYKLTVIGDSQVGKTTLIRKFVDHNAPDNYAPTIGVDFGLKDLTLGEDKCRVQIWDTAGQERFRAVTSCYFRGAHGVVLVYDVTQTSTFDNIQFHLAQAVKFTADDQPMVLVGNKCDLVHRRTVPYEMAKRYAEDFGMQFFETSAVTLNNVEPVFLKLIAQIRQRKQRQEEAEEGGLFKRKNSGGSGSQAGRVKDVGLFYELSTPKSALGKALTKCCS